MSMSKGTDLAPPGMVYKCMSCGKKSKTKYGFLVDGSNKLPDGTKVADSGYDESCMLNSELVSESEQM